MSKETPPRNAVTKRLYDREIAPVIKFCRANRGTIKRIHEVYQRTIRKPVNRDTVDRWLAPDPANRAEPFYGAGKLLMLVAARVIEQVKAEQAKIKAEWKDDRKKTALAEKF